MYSWVSRDVINFTEGQLQIDTLTSDWKKISLYLFTLCLAELLKKVPVKPKNTHDLYHDFNTQACEFMRSILEASWQFGHRMQILNQLLISLENDCFFCQ